MRFSSTLQSIAFTCPSTFISRTRCLGLNLPGLVYIKTKTSRSTGQSISKTTWHALGKQLFSTDTRQRWSNQFVCQTQTRSILGGLISRWRRWFSGSHCNHIEYCIRITVLVKSTLQGHSDNGKGGIVLRIEIKIIFFFRIYEIRRKNRD